MSFWKQLAVCAVVVLVAGGIWARFFPGAPEVLQRWGLDWAVAAVSGPSAEPSAEAPASGFNQQPGLVVAAQIQTATINDRLSAIGTGRALDSVAVMPFASGRLTEILVKSGSLVKVGDVLARLDSDAEEIALDRTRFALQDAEARLKRIQSLRSSNTATAVQLTEAELGVSNAKLAELTLERRSIIAPISGVVGILPVSVGNAVTAQTEIATIDDRTRIVVDFWAPERFAGMISIGQDVEASSIARPDESYSGEVSAIDNRIDVASRTLRIQARIDNAEDRLRAGMSFQVEMAFPGDTYPAVDPLAIQWGTSGAFVWAVDTGGIARRVPVRIIQRNTDSVLVAGDFGTASAVVTEGIHSVREGAPVRVVSGPTAEQQSAKAASLTGS